MSTSSCRSGSAHRVSTIFEGGFSAMRFFQLSKRYWKSSKLWAGLYATQGVNAHLWCFCFEKKGSDAADSLGVNLPGQRLAVFVLLCKASGVSSYEMDRTIFRHGTRGAHGLFLEHNPNAVRDDVTTTGEDRNQLC